MQQAIWPPVSVSLSGAATEAKQDAEIALLTTIDADTGSIAAATAAIAGDTSDISADTGSIAGSSSSTASSSSTTATNTGATATSVASIDGKTPALVSGRVPVDGSGVTQPVSAASLPLPSGAATETTLAALNGKVADDYGASSGAVRTAAQVGNASGVADFNSGAAGAQTLRAVLATRHEAAATPVSTRKGNGTNFDAYGTGADGADVPRATLSTRHEAAATPIAVRMSDGASFTEAVNTGANQLKGKIAGTALTGTYATLITLTFSARIVYLFNSCDNTILVSLDGGTTAGFELEAGESVTVDLAAAGLRVASGVNIQAKHNGVVPTAGTIRCTAVG